MCTLKAKGTGGAGEVSRGQLQAGTNKGPDSLETSPGQSGWVEWSSTGCVGGRASEAKVQTGGVPGSVGVPSLQSI